MLIQAYLLAAQLLGPVAGADRAMDVATDAYVVSLTEEPLYLCNGESCTEARHQTSLLLTTWAIRESAGLSNVWGDNHTSIGAMQFKAHYLKHPALKVYGATEKDVLSSRREGMRLGLAWMRHLRGVCGGSVRRALYAYASGSCIGSESVRKKVLARCELAGGC
jgi:hypothetical protein